RLLLRRDRNPTRLYLLRDLTPKIDCQEAVDESRAFNSHVVGELEATLERASGNAAMQILRILVGGFAARHEKHVLLLRDGKLVFAEAGHRHGDAVVVFVSLCDVIGRPVVDALDAAGGLQRIDQTVEADARPEQGRKIESGS